MTRVNSWKAQSLIIVDRLIVTLQKKRTHFLMASVALSHLTACNATGGKEQELSVQPTSLQITGTDGTVKSIAILRPTENGGKFSVAWHDQKTPSTAFGAYDVNVYLSNDPLVDTRDAMLYSTYNLGLGTLYAMGDDRGTGPDHSVTCAYNSDNSIDCIGRSNGSSRIDLQMFLTTVPKPAYIIVQACLRNGGPCSQASDSIILD